MLNEITLMGRLVKDPELRYTQSEKSVATFTVAVDRDFNPKGEMATDFIPCVAWNAGAEFISRHFIKGQMISVTGRLESRKWQDRDGNNRISWEVNVGKAYFCGDRKQTPENKFVEMDDDEGEIPF